MDERRTHADRRARLSFNITPMIDCTFQLILFFLLTTQFIRLAPLDLPRLHGPVSKLPATDKAVVDIVPHPEGDVRGRPALEGQAREYRLQQLRVDPGDVSRLVAVLLGAQQRSRRPGDFVVEVWADRRLHYGQIQPVLAALTRARLPNLHIAAQSGQGR